MGGGHNPLVVTLGLGAVNVGGNADEEGLVSVAGVEEIHRDVGGSGRGPDGGSGARLDPAENLLLALVVDVVIANGAGEEGVVGRGSDLGRDGGSEGHNSERNRLDEHFLGIGWL